MTTWTPVDLAAILDGRHVDPAPSIFARDDGEALLYAGRIHSISGEPEACKGWIALAATAERLEAGDSVLYVDFEDSAASVVTRLIALGVNRDAITSGLRYVRPDEPLNKTGRAELGAIADYRLAVLDGLTEALTLHGLDLASNTDVAKWLELLPRPLARAGAAVLEIDHVVKDREQRGRYAIGGQHKLAGIDCAYSVKVIHPFGRGRDGHVQLLVQKDRPGYVRGFAENGHVADVRLTSGTDGTVTVRLEATASRGAATTFRPTTLMGRVSGAIEATPGLSKRAIRTAVRGKNDAIDLALELLVAEGYVRAERDGQAIKHIHVRTFDPDHDDHRAHRAPTVPPPCPGHGPADRAPVPPPFRARGTGARPQQPEPADDETEARILDFVARHPEAVA